MRKELPSLSRIMYKEEKKKKKNWHTCQFKQDVVERKNNKCYCRRIPKVTALLLSDLAGLRGRNIRVSVAFGKLKNVCNLFNLKKYPEEERLTCIVVCG